MKRVLTIALILLILVPTGMKLAIVAYYQINKEYISNYFCENKTRPKMECNGKCFLAKKIKAQEEGEKNIPSLLKGMEEVLLFCTHLNFDFTFIPTFETINKLPAYLAISYNSPLENIFQPPQ